MRKKKILIIEDEFELSMLLKLHLLEKGYDVEMAYNIKDGLERVKTYSPDIVFLDIEMPRMNGFTMLQQLNNRDFELIFITAYDHFAIKAIKFSALDYLVKPVEIEDLKAAVEKVTQKRKNNSGNERLELLLQNLMNVKKEHQRIAIPSMEGLQFISISDIVYVESSNGLHDYASWSKALPGFLLWAFGN